MPEQDAPYTEEDLEKEFERAAPAEQPEPAGYEFGMGDDPYRSAYDHDDEEEERDMPSKNFKLEPVPKPRPERPDQFARPEEPHVVYSTALLNGQQKIPNWSDAHDLAMAAARVQPDYHADVRRASDGALIGVYDQGRMEQYNRNGIEVPERVNSVLNRMETKAEQDMANPANPDRSSAAAMLTAVQQLRHELHPERDQEHSR